MNSEPIKLFCLSAQARWLPNDIAVSVHAALNARKAFLAGLDAITYAKTLKDTKTCRAVRLYAIARGEAAVDDALQAAVQAASQTMFHAAHLCRWIGRVDLACAHAWRAFTAKAADIHDPQIWSQLANWLVAPAALARGFHPGFKRGAGAYNDELLSDAVLSTHESIWPELVNAILLEPRGPAPRAREGAQAAFVLDLRELVERLRGGNHRYGNEMWRLTSFRNGDPDYRGDDDVPDQWCAFNCIGMPWRGHDVPVLRAEIEAAGYDDLATVLRAAGENPRYDPTAGSRTVMGSLVQPRKLCDPVTLDLLKPWQTQKVMPAVADFIERLVQFIECRSP
jgi:hypothetical protein